MKDLFDVCVISDPVMNSLSITANNIKKVSL